MSLLLLLLLLLIIITTIKTYLNIIYIMYILNYNSTINSDITFWKRRVNYKYIMLLKIYVDIWIRILRLLRINNFEQKALVIKRKYKLFQFFVDQKFSFDFIDNLSFWYPNKITSCTTTSDQFIKYYVFNFGDT